MNGRELVAEDIVFNYHRFTGLGSGFTEASPFGGSITQVPIESIEATDTHTVVVRLKQPSFTALDVLLFNSFEGGWMYPPEVIEEHGNVQDWRNLVGTGPYSMTEWVEGSGITYTKNPNYWKDDEKFPGNRLPYADEIKLLFMADTSTQLAALLLRCAPRAEVGCRIDDAECGGGRSVPSACLERNGGTAERWPDESKKAADGADHAGRCQPLGLRTARPRCWRVWEGDTETSVVDAQALAQDGPGERLAGAAESGADRLGERGRRGVGAVDEQREGLVAAA